MRVRRYSFNIHNYQELTFNEQPINKDTLIQLFTNMWKIDYMIVGQETTNENNIPHLQGYIEFTNVADWQQVHQRFISTIGRVSDLQISKGDAQSNYNYCSKSNDYQTYGTLSQSLKIEDIATNVVQLLTQGLKLSEIILANKEYSTYIVRNYHNLQKIQSDLHMSGQISQDQIENGDLPW
jgi:hypothetical protein